jgi:hypothetical protein
MGVITSYVPGRRSTFDDAMLMEIAGRPGKSAAQMDAALSAVAV